MLYIGAVVTKLSRKEESENKLEEIVMKPQWFIAREDESAKLKCASLCPEFDPETMTVLIDSPF